MTCESLVQCDITRGYNKSNQLSKKIRLLPVIFRHIVKKTYKFEYRTNMYARMCRPVCFIHVGLGLPVAKSSLNESRI